jgi:hypothetical protein
MTNDEATSEWQIDARMPCSRSSKEARHPERSEGGNVGGAK